MAVSEGYVPYIVQAGNPLVSIGGITSQRINTGTEVRSEHASGESYARAQGVRAQNPGISFTTRDLATALGEIGLNGLQLDSGTGAGESLVVWGQKVAAGGTRDAASVHRKWTVIEGLVVPRAITCDHGGDAELPYDCFPIWDGSANDPIEITENNALPAAVTTMERFTLGPVTIGGIALTGHRRVTIDFGLTVSTEGSEGDIWPTFVWIQNELPTITIEGVSLTWVKDSGGIPLIGKSGTVSDTIIYLRKRAQGGTIVANGTAEHLKFTAGGYCRVENAFDGAGNELAECSLVFEAIQVGATAPLAMNLASTIA